MVRIEREDRITHSRAGHSVCGGGGGGGGGSTYVCKYIGSCLGKNRVKEE